MSDAPAAAGAQANPALAGRVILITGAGGYGIAQSANAALVSMLAAELRNDPVQVSGLQPSPMRTPLRQRAYVAEVAAAACGPDQVAAACVELLGAAGAAWRGITRTLDMALPTDATPHASTPAGVSP